MSFFSVTYDVAPAQEILSDLRQKVSAVRAPVFEAVRGPIRDAVNRDVEQLIAPAPGPSKHPFEFQTLPSRNWYFWMKRTGQIPGQSWNPDGGSWDRTNTLESGWTTSVNVSANDAFMSIENDSQDYKGDYFAQAVYGPEAVPGFEDTDWGETIDAATEQIADHLEIMLLDAIDEALAGFRS